MKKILLTISSIALLLLTISVVRQFDHTSPSTFFPALLQAWLINMYVTGIVAFLTFAYPMFRLLPKSYFEISSAPKIKRIFTQFRVDLFQKLLLATIWRNKEKQKGFFTGGKKGLDLFEYNSKNAEFGHLIPFIGISIIAIYVAVLGFYLFAICMLMFNILGNLYPIFLQRYHRSRIQRIKVVAAQRSAWKR